MAQLEDNSSDINQRGYSRPDALVSTEWLAQQLETQVDPQSLRIIESNEDQLLYSIGHIPGAVEIDWVRDLNDPLRRDYIDREKFESLMSKIGATSETTFVFYGDKSNWWACYAFWVFQLFGHTNAKILDGGKLKWEREARPISTAVPTFASSSYRSPERDDSSLRAFRDEVLLHVQQARPLIDVRSPEEFSGKRLHMEAYPNEGALRGGHIPGAHNVPWAQAVSPVDGTFKTAAELKLIYQDALGLAPQDPLIAYCRIGERSSHSWFVLKYLLGFSNVRNYDGSWTEWGNSVGLPIAR